MRLLSDTFSAVQQSSLENPVLQASYSQEAGLGWLAFAPSRLQEEATQPADYILARR
jgi:hypothetical protein